MNDHILRQELERVARRYRRIVLWVSLATGWLLLAAAGVAALAWARGWGHVAPGVILVLLAMVAIALIPVLMSWLGTIRDPLWIARRIERQYPDLDARLLAALEQKPEGGALGFLQQAVIGETVDHARRHDWQRVVPPAGLRAAWLAHWATVLVLAAVLVTLVVDGRKYHGRAGGSSGAIALRHAAFEITVEPGDTSIERGTALLVLARFGGSSLPGDVRLLFREPDGPERQMPMSKSLDDPLFAGRVPSVNRDLTYSVRYGDAQTQWYKASVFDFPDLRQADARLKFPEYTGMPEKLVEDTRSVTAVVGTKATLVFRLNKPVAEARLVPQHRGPQNDASPAAVDLTPDPADPSVYSVALDLKQSQKYQLQLVDKQHRANKDPAELAINVTANKPPDLKVEQPAKDVDVSPLEELAIKAKVWDDYGVKRVGLTYSLGGQEPKEVVLAEGVASKDRREVAKLLSMEQLAAQPDQLLSYHLWAEDVGPDGKPRRTSGDMFFAEVRPFDEIFRQGEQPAGGEEQQQQQQQAGQNAQKAEELAELQKQIIAATWKVIRRETAETPSAPFVPDVKLIGESQASAKEKAAPLAEKLSDERSRGFLESALKNMDRAIEKLSEAETTVAPKPLPGALSAEQAAYQELLKLRAHEHEVIRSKSQQGKGQQANSKSARQQRQLNQLELAKEDNRYETQRAAAAQPQDGQQRETRQVLSRLRELAQRQEDLNRQMKELQSALQKANEQAQREEIERQLARLRDQQQQMLRDTDELRDRMDQPENQERMADSRQQLEQTRSDVRKASESLQKGQVPEASAAGQRASEQFNNLREQFRRTAAGQFDETMTQMRQDARELDKKQQELSQRMTELDAPRDKGTPRQAALRDAVGNRPQVAQNLKQQKQQLDNLLENMKKTVEEAENSEPLLSRQLYESIRKTRQEQTDKALDDSRQLLEKGLVAEARQSETQAGKGITQLREGVEQAAQSVLGGQTESLRRARNELNELSQRLDREMSPAARGNQQAAGNQPATRPGNDQVAQNTPNPRNAQQPGNPPAMGNSSTTGRRPMANNSRGSRASRAEAGSVKASNRASTARHSKRTPASRAKVSSPARNRSQANSPASNPVKGSKPAPSPASNPGSVLARAGSPAPTRRKRLAQPGNQSGQADPTQPDAQANAARPDETQKRDAAQPGQRQQPNSRDKTFRLPAGPDAERDPRRARDHSQDDPNDNTLAPITGGGFREWSDRMRDVEEMVGDPRLRAEAARIRERVGAFRADYKRHAEPPNWDLVRENIGRPLVELREAVAQELLRRESPEALVPIDREPVLPEYADQVRRYYERLGRGK